VTDFGVGLAVVDSSQPNQTQHALGTLRYMPPERLAGTFDARSDVYSLGATLYELVSQTPLYAAVDRRELVRLIKQSSPPPLLELVPTIPRDLATIIHRALAGDPSARYSSAQALIGDLTRFLQGESLEAPRPGFFRRLFRRRSR
jgi:serine/threonine protein kinase